MRKQSPHPPTSRAVHMLGEAVFAHPLQPILTGTAILAGDDTVVSWNAWAERLTGYTLD